VARISGNHKQVHSEVSFLVPFIRWGSDSIPNNRGARREYKVVGVGAEA
jgi:hypothetical protein